MRKRRKVAAREETRQVKNSPPPWGEVASGLVATTGGFEISVLPAWAAQTANHSAGGERHPGKLLDLCVQIQPGCNFDRY